jgi:hypothetical protein
MGRKVVAAFFVFLLVLAASPAFAQLRHVVVDNTAGNPVGVTCISGCAGGTPVTAADTMANPTVPTNLSYGLLFNGTTWDRVRGDTTNGMWVNCKSGCVGSTSVLMADTTANPTIPQNASFGMLYNGTTWDRWRGTTTNGAWVEITA